MNELDEDEDEIRDNFKDVLNEIKKIYSSLDYYDDVNFLDREVCEDCCVCYGNSRTKTSCGHPLCIKCFFKLKYQQMYPPNTKISREGILCPTCRAVMVAQPYFFLVEIVDLSDW